MSRVQQIREVLLALLTMACAGLLVMYPHVGYAIVVAILCISLIVSGIGRIRYYLTMARYMVGGKSVMYTGIIQCDLGMLTMGVSAIPRQYVMLYLFAIHFFAGLVGVLRAREARSLEASSSWKPALANAVFNVLIAVTCIVFIGSERTAVYIYSAGLAISAFNRVATALRHTEVVYIQ